MKGGQHVIVASFATPLYARISIVLLSCCGDDQKKI